MTPKEKKWTQLIAWVNNNTCFSGKDVLEVIRALEDSSKCEPSDRECSSCQFHIEDGICGITKKPIWGRCGLWQTNSKSCKCIDYDVTKICLTCLHRVTVGHEPYCDDPNSGWGYHGKILRCERWQSKSRVCKTCKYLEFTKNTGAPYCTNLGSGWEYSNISCHLWKEKDKSCSTCKFYRKDGSWCSNFNLELRWCDSCPEWKPTNKEPTDVTDLLIKLVTGLQTKVQDLSLQLDIMKLDYPPKSPNGGRKVRF